MKWLQEQRAGYSSLIKVLERQKASVLKDDEGKLLQTINEKERILGNLYEIDRKMQFAIESLGQKDHTDLIKVSQPLRDEIEILLSQALTLETFCETHIEKKKSSLRDQMKNTKHGRSVLKGYGATLLQQSRFSKNA
tara:strand:+ start:1506 stop:1916 length:411 start_codon:yes stop_codon:yes gene_type:complete